MQTLKNLLRYPLDIRRAAKLLTRTQPPAKAKLDQRQVVLDLHTDHLLIDLGRHIACLAHHARTVGSPVVIRSNRQILAGIARKPYGRQALCDPSVRWVPETEAITPDALVFTDDDSGNTVGIQLLIGRDVVAGSAVMPFPMHPSTLEHVSGEKLARFRANTERLGILFAGNQKAGLTNVDLENEFSVMTRPRLLRTVHDHFGDRIAHSLSTTDNTVRITLRSETRNAIASKNWLPTLSMYDFFICPPGTNQPLSHHVIEAMSVGTVPILEYADSFHPTLSDGENAICFDDSDGLIAAINRIDTLTEEQISELRTNVINYYEKHLCGERFLQRLRDTPRPEKFVSMPFHHENLYRMPSKKRQRSAA